MPSPFPGMDPHIESQEEWADFHTSLMAEIKSALNRRLPERYRAAVEVYIWLHEPSAEIRKVFGRPDVTVRRESKGAVVKSDGAETAVAEPPTAPTVAGVLVTDPPVRRRYVRVIDIKDRRVVTAIEVLSPSNKTAAGRETSLMKRDEYLLAGTHLVEIDLLRGGMRLPMGKPEAPASDYASMVVRADRSPEIGAPVRVWAFGVRDPLPVLPVPLDAGVPEVSLPLKECFDRVYDGSRYASDIDYGRPPEPPLSEADAAWVAEVCARR